MRLWLDDVRPMLDDFDVACRHASDAITILKTGEVSFVSFDHDLGNTLETGYTVACFLEKAISDGTLMILPDYAVHSGNPVGAANIRRAMESALAIERRLIQSP